MRNFILFLAIFCFTIPAIGQTFCHEGIYYEIWDTENRTCRVVRNQDDPSVKYEGDIIIPTTVSFEGDDYTVTVIMSSAFRDCWDLTSVILPETITEIGYNSFSGCSSLRSINLPEGLQTIGSYAFDQCSQLPNITLPQTLSVLDEDAFRGCASFTEIVIPSSLTELSPSVFSWCTSLISVTIPETITKIQSQAFDTCSALETIDLPSCLVKIGSGAFKSCENLKKIEIPETVTSIELGAFNRCWNLESVYIPSSVTYIGEEAFATETEALTSVTYNSTNPISGSENIFSPINYSYATLYMPAVGLTEAESVSPWNKFEKKQLYVASGIDCAKFTKGSDYIYKINGEKIEEDVKNLKQGLYIINGKKRLVK